MFKIGDIVVKTRTSSSTNRLGSKKGDIWKINKLTKYTPNSAYYQDGNTHSSAVRKAKNSEIKWFEAGITNINQIPEVDNNFWYLNEIKTISTIKNGNVFCDKDWTNFSFKEFLQITNDINSHNKPPVKSTVDREVMFGKPFTPEDLKNCKIGNLTPEENEIIQNWGLTLPNKLHWGAGKTLRNLSAKYLFIDPKYILSWGAEDYFKRNTTFTEIKKETILNYIKQLNTNKNYEQINKKTEIKPINRRVAGRSISIPTIAGSITSASRLIGNKASGKCVKSEIRKFKIVANIITC